MAAEAEQLLAGSGWLPEPLRTPKQPASFAEAATTDLARDGDPAADDAERVSGQPAVAAG
jgi:ParB family chromosome partitioning protein